MDITRQLPPPSLGAAWLAQAHRHPWTTGGLAATILVMAGLLIVSVWQVIAGEADAALRLGLLGGLAGFAATALGALPALILRALSQRTEDVMLGLAAGAMIFVVSHEVIPETHRNGHQTPRHPGPDGRLRAHDDSGHHPRLSAALSSSSRRTIDRRGAAGFLLNHPEPDR